MYAVTFELDIERLKSNYPQFYNNAYAEIRKYLRENNFSWQQGSVYFGNEKINAATCVYTIQQLSKKFEWFKNSVRDIRMLRIEENNDLLEII